MSLHSFILKHRTKIRKISSYESFLFIGPHPDDIELGCGALVSKLAAKMKKINFLICTDGKFGNFNRMDLTEEQIVKLRKNELYNSSFELGVFNIRLLNFSDGGFYSDYDMTSEIAKAIGDINPDVVFVTDPDVHTEFHPDHIRIGKIVKTVVSQASNPRIMEKYGARSASIKAVAFYFSSATNCVCRAGRAFKTKMRAVFDCHLSQFPLNSTATYSFKKYLKFRKFFGKEESFRVVTHIQMHCFPEADE